MHGSGSGAAESHSQSLLLSFKPRQVVLAQTTTTATTNTNTRRKMMMNKDQTLNPIQSSLLLSSVLCYLNNNSFSKPLKYLISAAQIQDDSWKTCSLNLEDIFKHYMETCCSSSNADAKLDITKEKESLSNETKKDGDDHSSEEAIVKKEKKKDKGDDNKSESVVAVAEVVELKTEKKTKKSSDSVEETEQATELATKEHKNKNKKKKHNPEPVESNVDSKEEVKSEDKEKKSEPNAKSDCKGEADPVAEVKSKDKKKKKKKQSSDLDVEMADKTDEKERVLSDGKTKEKDDSASGKVSNGVAEVANEKSELDAKSNCDGEADPVAEVKSRDKKKKKKKQALDLDVEMADKTDEKDTVLSDGKTKEKDDSASGKASNGVAEVANERGVEKEKSQLDAKSNCDGKADPEAEIKSKDKKKKKKKQALDLGIEMADKTDGKETVLVNDATKEKDGSASGKVSNEVAEVANEKKEKKESKKRKRSESVENDTGITNGDDEVKGKETTGKKSRKKDNNGSTEPKSVIAFQRVKIDDVKFADERLQDNSYWAKDGADVGYGAKAQEVLGQVKGRDFRHEKTKKKRGSYRGGQIDLHSHSVKFNYDDDDEE